MVRESIFHAFKEEHRQVRDTIYDLVDALQNGRIDEARSAWRSRPWRAGSVTSVPGATRDRSGRRLPCHSPSSRKSGRLEPTFAAARRW